MERSLGLRLRCREVLCHREGHYESSLGIVTGGRRPRRLSPIQTARGEQGQARAGRHLGRRICHGRRAAARRAWQGDRFRRRTVSGCGPHLSGQRDVCARQGTDGPRPDPDPTAEGRGGEATEGGHPGWCPRSVWNPPLHLRIERRHPADLFGPNQCRCTANRLHRWARKQPRLRRLPTPSALIAVLIASFPAAKTGVFMHRRNRSRTTHSTSFPTGFGNPLLRIDYTISVYFPITIAPDGVRRVTCHGSRRQQELLCSCSVVISSSWPRCKPSRNLRRRRSSYGWRRTSFMWSN